MRLDDPRVKQMKDGRFYFLRSDGRRAFYVIGVCLRCGEKRFSRSANSNYCSFKCAVEAKKGANSYNWKGGGYSHFCKQCKKLFKTKTRRMVNKKRKYCSDRKSVV